MRSSLFSNGLQKFPVAALGSPALHKGGGIVSRPVEHMSILMALTFARRSIDGGVDDLR